MPHIEVINAMADGWDTEDFEMICNKFNFR